MIHVHLITNKCKGKGILYISISGNNKNEYSITTSFWFVFLQHCNTKVMMNKCMVMQNGFQFATGVDGCIVFLFSGWNVDSHVKYAFMLIGVVCMGLLNGFLAFIRHYLVNKSKTNSSLLVYQIYLALIYGIQIVLAYWMMLLVMTYETGVFLALIFGLMIGYFIFSLIQTKNKSSVSGDDSTYQNQFNNTPCCQTVS
ncbi:hypothetical protein I4U23_016101 [Adineta vaga]|nr:hypothetical protein I4U23_016101 [Adineta vaga]